MEYTNCRAQNRGSAGKFFRKVKSNHGISSAKCKPLPDRRPVSPKIRSTRGGGRNDDLQGEFVEGSFPESGTRQNRSPVSAALVIGFITGASDTQNRQVRQASHFHRGRFEIGRAHV